MDASQPERPAILLQRAILGPVQTNAYLVVCEETREAALIDPGDDPADLIARAKELGATITWIVNTHGHADHIGGNAAAKSACPGATLAIHPADEKRLTDPEANLSLMFGFPFTSPGADILLHDGDEVEVGEIRFRVIAVPGHTPGGIALYAETRDGPVLFGGDALFAGSIGRSDFPGGDHDQLVASIRERLLTLPSETRVLSGHGEATTIGREAATNPFLAGDLV